MSVAVLRAGPSGGALSRLLIAGAAVIAVGLLALLAGALLLPGTPAPALRNPFGMGLREAAPAASGLSGLLLGWQSAFFGSLRAAFTALRDSGSGLPLLVGIGFAYGVFHAAGPGHGKAVIAAYLVSSERALARGLALSAAAALVQALVAIALVAVIFLALGGTAATMSRAANATELAGFGLVALLGAVLVWRKAGKLLALVSPSASGRAGADPCACQPVDPSAAEGGSFRQMAAVAVGAGIRPCAGAIVVLTLARSYGMFASGIAAVLAMALGTALTTGFLAAVAVYAKRVALRLASGRGRWAAYLGATAELAAASLVVVIGLALMAGLWGSPAGA